MTTFRGAATAVQQTGPTSAGMVASVGHLQDNEDEGMTSMRARWYEPALGGFIAEGPATDGSN